MSEDPSQTVTLEAPAKVNLFLRVLGRRPDGYHDLETLVVPITLSDRLLIHADAGPAFRTLALTLAITGDPDMTRGVPVDGSNLALRAAAALAGRVGVQGFADITVEKRVPPAAGLGGGSADAAATLVALNRLWSCGLEAEELMAVGAAVGSDVPALLAGGPVVATGRGEQVVPARCPSVVLALVRFGFSVSTPDAFRWWDEEEEPSSGTALPTNQPLSPTDLASEVFNDLERPVIRRHPEIGEAKDVLRRGGAAGAVMSGSGPTVVGLLRPGLSSLHPAAERELIALSGQPPSYVRSLG